VGHYPVGNRPRGITLSPDGRELYVCASDDDLVRVFDPQTMQETHTLPSGPDPELFVLSPDGGRLYIANEDDNLVTVVDT
ncbi:beta-propeller fold lactonase family protein, partial [Salmonella enterica subsp. enterica serovar Enteritidis]